MPNTPMEAIVCSYTEPTPTQKAFAANQLPALADAIHAYTSNVPDKSAQPISFCKIQAAVTRSTPMSVPAIAMALAALQGNRWLIAQVVKVLQEPQVCCKLRDKTI
jgi:hypothetical protein